ncbi:MAG: redoxin domain-containing protein [Clostridia bacterium]|nr:redoxin domain-containing protein [Clostridia bacterium]
MEFHLETTEGPLRYPKDFQGRWTLLFYYSGDFLPVSATELLELAALQETFKENGCQILCISEDRLSVHLAFLETLSRYRLGTRIFPPIQFPLGCDLYGQLRAQMGLSDGKKYLWLLAPDGAPQAHFSYPAEIGVNFTEPLRTLLALQTCRPTPCNWVPEEYPLLPPPSTRKESYHYMQKQEQAGNLCIDWYLCFGVE